MNNLSSKKKKKKKKRKEKEEGIKSTAESILPREIFAKFLIEGKLGELVSDRASIIIN